MRKTMSIESSQTSLKDVSQRDSTSMCCGSSEVSLLDSCVVYESIPTLLGSNAQPSDPKSTTSTTTDMLCGHVHHLRTLIRYLQDQSYKNIITKNSCPLCHHPISFICDQLCHVMEDRAPIITFKYSKQTYRLSVVKDSSVTSQQYSYLWTMFWWWPWRFSSNTHKSYYDTERYNAVVVTAQDRIVDALSLKKDSLKIIHKGKLIFPDESLSPSECSAKLIDVSNDDWRRSRKASLVVLGVLRDEEKEKEDASRRWQRLASRFVGMGWNFIRMISHVACRAAWRLVIYCYRLAMWKPFLHHGADHPRQD